MISLPAPGCIQDHQHPEQDAVRPKAHSLLLLLNSSLQPFPIPKARSRLWEHPDVPSPATSKEAAPAGREGEHTHPTHTLYTRDIPRKKHLIHPLNNSDTRICLLSTCFKRDRCYENIANIQKYTHLETTQPTHINYLQ